MAVVMTRFVGSLMRNTVKVTRCVARQAVASHSTSLKLSHVLAAYPQNVSPQPTCIQYDRRCFLFTSKDKTDYVSKDMTIADVMDGVLHKYLVLIDVREPHELKETGKIGDAINIPVDDIEKAFSMSDDEFKAKYHIYKPNIMSERVVVYCRTGKRALKVCEKLHKMGYEKVKRYPGGMKEWSKILFGQADKDEKKKEE